MSNEAGKIVSVDLDAQLKKMTIVLDSKRDTQAQYEIAIPSELLSGDLVVTVLDGGQQAILTGDEYLADASGPVVDPVNDPRHIYSVSAFKRDGYAQVGFIDDVGGMRTIEIQGRLLYPSSGRWPLLSWRFSSLLQLRSLDGGRPIICIIGQKLQRNISQEF